MKYWISRAGQQFGPYSFTDLQTYVAQGNILMTDLACGEGQTQWVPVSQVLGAAAQPPRPQQPQAQPQPQAIPQSYSAPPAYGQPLGVAAQPAMGPAMDYATWGNRALGYIIDSLLAGAVVGVLYAVLGSLLAGLAASFGSNSAFSGACCVMLILFPVGALLFGVYNRVYLVSQRGYSIGQGVVKVKVVDVNGNLLPRNTALIRLLAQIGLGLIPFLSIIDLLWPLWDVQRQTLHDKAVSSFVVNNPQRA